MFNALTKASCEILSIIQVISSFFVFNKPLEIPSYILLFSQCFLFWEEGLGSATAIPTYMKPTMNFFIKETNLVQIYWRTNCHIQQEYMLVLAIMFCKLIKNMYIYMHANNIKSGKKFGIQQNNCYNMPMWGLSHRLHRALLYHHSSLVSLLLSLAWVVDP